MGAFQVSSITFSRRRVNFVLFAIFLLISAVGYSVTSTFPSPFLPGYPGSAMFPRLVLVAMAVISVAGLLRTVLSGSKKIGTGSVTVPIVPFLAVIALLLSFAAALQILGMEIAVFAMIAGCIWFRNRNLLVSAAVGLASVAVVYFVFVQALSVHLPLQFLPRYLF